MKRFLLHIALILSVFTADAAIIVPEFNVGIDDEVVIESSVRNNIDDNSINTPHIMIFHNIDRFVYENIESGWIRIYDADWNLIEETNESINIDLNLGRYVIESEVEIRFDYSDSFEDAYESRTSWIM